MSENLGQTQRMSLLESFISIIAGYLLTVLIQYYLFPFFGIEVPLTDTLVISFVVVLIAFAKNYCVRRFFNFLSVS